MRFSVDTNILFYTFDASDERRIMAHHVMRAAMLADCVLTNQVLGELLSAVTRRHPSRAASARDAIASWSVIFPVVPTETEHLLVASRSAERHRLQYWDSVILCVAGSAGARWLLTEDMQDGSVVDGVRLLNPFSPANAEMIDLLLTPAP